VKAQKKKDDAKLCITQLAEKRHQEITTAKEKAAQEVTEAETATQAIKEETTKANDAQEMSLQG